MPQNLRKKPLPRHDNCISLITGAAHGIGRAIALRLASEGAAIAIVDLDAAGAEATAAMIRDAGGRSFATEADITDMTTLD
ncbi:MAG: SDR family NAD(P)-dependent oxidoreductase, partial [Candidatus Saccharibacteria bacterium]|nr:SDR family NAD(P)-dependent oxidoreductase [Pseudorhodobacter sp.]